MQGCSPREHSRPLLCGLGLGLGLDTYGLDLGSRSRIIGLEYFQDQYFF